MKRMEIELSQPTKELLYALKLKPDYQTIHDLIDSGLMLKFTTAIHPPNKQRNEAIMKQGRHKRMVSSFKNDSL